MGRPEDCNCCEQDIIISRELRDCDKAICIAIIADNNDSDGRNTVDDKFAKWIENFPNRILFVVDVFLGNPLNIDGSPKLYFPDGKSVVGLPSWNDHNHAFNLRGEFIRGLSVPEFCNRDNGDVGLATDIWAALSTIVADRGLTDDFDAAREVSIFVDVSDSMPKGTVDAAYDLLISRIKAAGKRPTASTFNTNKDYICPFVNKCCTTESSTDFRQSCGAGPTSCEPTRISAYLNTTKASSGGHGPVMRTYYTPDNEFITDDADWRSAFGGISVALPQTDYFNETYYSRNKRWQTVSYNCIVYNDEGFVIDYAEVAWQLVYRDSASEEWKDTGYSLPNTLSSETSFLDLSFENFGGDSSAYGWTNGVQNIHHDLLEVGGGDYGYTNDYYRSWTVKTYNRSFGLRATLVDNPEIGATARYFKLCDVIAPDQTTEDPDATFSFELNGNALGGNTILATSDHLQAFNTGEEFLNAPPLLNRNGEKFDYKIDAEMQNSLNFILKYEVHLGSNRSYFPRVHYYVYPHNRWLITIYDPNRGVEKQYYTKWFNLGLLKGYDRSSPQPLSETNTFYNNRRAGLEFNGCLTQETTSNTLRGHNLFYRFNSSPLGLFPTYELDKYAFQQRLSKVDIDNLSLSFDTITENNYCSKTYHENLPNIDNITKQRYPGPITPPPWPDWGRAFQQGIQKLNESAFYSRCYKQTQPIIHSFSSYFAKRHHDELKLSATWQQYPNFIPTRNQVADLNRAIINYLFDEETAAEILGWASSLRDLTIHIGGRVPTSYSPRRPEYTMSRPFNSTHQLVATYTDWYDYHSPALGLSDLSIEDANDIADMTISQRLYRDQQYSKKRGYHQRAYAYQLSQDGSAQKHQIYKAKLPYQYKLQAEFRTNNGTHKIVSTDPFEMDVLYQVLPWGLIGENFIGRGTPVSYFRFGSWGGVRKDSCNYYNPPPDYSNDNTTYRITFAASQFLNNDGRYSDNASDAIGVDYFQPGSAGQVGGADRYGIQRTMKRNTRVVIRGPVDLDNNCPLGLNTDLRSVRINGRPVPSFPYEFILSENVMIDGYAPCAV